MRVSRSAWRFDAGRPRLDLYEPSPQHPGVVGDDFFLGVVDRVGVFQGDGAGDGLDHAEGGGSALVFSLGGIGAAGQVNADLGDELSAVCDLAGALDQDLGGAECDGLDGTVLEVKETRRDEEEEKDSR